MPRKQKTLKILFTFVLIVTIIFTSSAEAKAEQVQPKKVQEAQYPPPLNAPSWTHETGVGHIFLPDPRNDNWAFPLDVNVTVLNDNSFVQGSISFIEINITIPNDLVSYLDLQAIAFDAEITNALQATSTQASTQAFFMFLMPENYYFPNIILSNLIPYDWAGSSYIVLQDAGQINLTLSSGLAVPKNVSVSPDWQQRSQFTTSLTIPLITINPIQAPTSTPKKTIFNQPVNDPYNFWYIAILSCSIVFDFTLALFLKYYRKIRKSNFRKDVWEIALYGFAGFLSVAFIPDLLLVRPYDLNIGQVIAIIIVSIVGILLVIKEKRLVFSFLRGKKG